MSFILEDKLLNFDTEGEECENPTQISSHIISCHNTSNIINQYFLSLVWYLNNGIKLKHKYNSKPLFGEQNIIIHMSFNDPPSGAIDKNALVRWVATIDASISRFTDKNHNGLFNLLRDVLAKFAFRICKYLNTNGKTQLIKTPQMVSRSGWSREKMENHLNFAKERALDRSEIFNKKKIKLECKAKGVSNLDEEEIKQTLVYAEYKGIVKRSKFSEFEIAKNLSSTEANKIAAGIQINLFIEYLGKFVESTHPDKYSTFQFNTFMLAKDSCAITRQSLSLVDGNMWAETLCRQFLAYHRYPFLEFVGDDFEEQVADRRSLQNKSTVLAAKKRIKVDQVSQLVTQTGQTVDSRLKLCFL
jgi:hypothetical protein